MATLFLTSAASKGASLFNSSLGLNSVPFIGSKISSQISGLFKGFGKSIGEKIDEKIFGTIENNRIVGPRLSDLSVQTSTYGDVISQIYGRNRVAGNIIWAQKVKEIPVTEEVSSGGKGGSFGAVRNTKTRFNYTVTFAVAVCEGEVDSIERFWANSELINPSKFCTSYEIHNGSETQNCSAIIESFEGVGNTPAYKGLAYIVFEDFDISSFGNRIPNLTFEVNNLFASALDGSESSVENMVSAINLIPGSGEFVYDTEIQTKIYGYDLAGKWIQTGEKETINSNNAANEADVKISLENMQKTFPNLEWVSVICVWFADSLDIATATITPRVEYINGTITEPDLWNVAGIARSAAIQVTLDDNDRPLYGGTPSDKSITNLLDELNSMGYKIMFYPMIFVDQSTKPWRGKMTGSAPDISNFFTKTNGYNNFINHYANLTKNKVDAFIIGSEMKGLTSVQAVDDSFPAVTEFVSLAANVKTIMGTSTKISYAADWSEYHSVNGWFNMDSLWASANIDFVGIDAYFPLTDEPQNGIYDLQKVIDGWENGEGYDWYYSDEARTNKVNYNNAIYAWKNIEYWWGNTHTNPDESATAWVAESKPIWFTEFGFPSVDGATNQPNVFYNPDSEDGGLPYHSKGYVDLLAQKLGIEATLKKWEDSAMVEQKFLWAWDARPYPFWPDLNDIWSDGNMWSKGHWVQGKLGLSSLREVIKAICEKAGINTDDLNFNNVTDVLEGYIIRNRADGIEALDFITEPNFIFASENGSAINFINKNSAEKIQISIDELLIDEEDSSYLKITSISEQKLPEKIDVNYIDSKTGYLVGNQSAERDSREGITKLEFNLPVSMSRSFAKRLAERHLLDSWSSSKMLEFRLDRSKLYIEAGDNIEIVENEESGDVLYNIFVNSVIHDDDNIIIKGSFYDTSIYENYYGDLKDDDAKIESLSEISDTRFEIINLPLISDDDENRPIMHVACCAYSSNWSGAALYYKNKDSADEYRKIADTEAKAIIGNILQDMEAGSPSLLDEKSQIDIALISGELESLSEEEFYRSNKNYAYINGEIIKFRNAELISDNTYRISGILRGLFGTEDLSITHLAGENLILLNENIQKIPLGINLINNEFDFKAVSYGKILDDAELKSYQVTARNLKPYSVVNIEAVKNGTSGDIEISFNRRSRANYNWAVATPPLAEQSEKYELDILNSNDEVIRTINSTSSLVTYSDAEQIEDFGSSQSELKLNIYQISDLYGRGIEAYMEESF